MPGLSSIYCFHLALVFIILGKWISHLWWIDPLIWLPQAGTPFLVIWISVFLPCSCLCSSTNDIIYYKMKRKQYFMSWFNIWDSYDIKSLHKYIQIAISIGNIDNNLVIWTSNVSNVRILFQIIILTTYVIIRKWIKWKQLD